MSSRPWRRAPLACAALLLLPGIASAQKRVDPAQLKVSNARAEMTISIPALTTLPQGAVKAKGSRLPLLSSGNRYTGAPGTSGTPVKMPSISAQSPNVLRNFAGTPAEASLEPPDMGLAVGPNHVVEATNDALAVYDLNGNRLVHVAWTSFLSAGSPATNAFSDPEVVYDNYHDRFLMTIAAYNTSTNVGRVWLVTSNTNDPTGAWTGGRFSMNGSGQQLLIDYPRLGFNSDSIFISGALFDFLNGYAASGSKVLHLNLAKAVGSPVAFTGFIWSGFATDVVAPAQMHTTQFDPTSPTHSIGYMVQAPDGGGTSVTLWRLAADWSVPAVYFFDGWIEGVSATTVPPGGGQPYSGSVTINTGDCRVANCTFINGHLECAQTTGFDQGAPYGIHSAIKTNHWDCTTTRDGTGAAVPESMTRDTTVYVGGDYDLFYPACQLNGDGDSLFVVGASSKSNGIPASLFSVAWRTTGLDGSFNVVKYGESIYGYTRWGDYFGAALDPFDNKTVWVAGEYTTASGNAPFYGTWIGETNYKPLTSLTLDAASGVRGFPVTLTAHLSRADSGDPSGQTISFAVDGVTVGSGTTDGAGTASVVYTIPADAAMGSHNMTATFERTTTLNRSTGSNTLSVVKADTSVAVANVATYPGGTVNLKATLTRNIDGGPIASRTVTFTVGSTLVGDATTDVNGVATKSYTVPSTTPVGTDLTITAAFAGDGDYNASSNTGTLGVDKKTTVTSANATGNSGATINLKGILKSGSTVIPGATLTFKVDGSVVGTQTTDSTGTALLSHTLTEDARATHVLTVEFAGDGTNAPATSINYTLTVKPLATTIAVAAVTAVPGSSTNLTATLKSGTTLLGSRSLDFQVDGTSVGSATTNSSGVATLPHSVTEAAGTHTITAKYAGDAVYAAATGNGTLTVKKIDTKTTASTASAKVGANATLKAVVKAGTTPLVSVTVHFSVDGSAVGDGTTDSTGTATFAFKMPEWVGTTHSYTATYDGDGTYNGSTSTAAAINATAAATKVTGEAKTGQTPGATVSLGAVLTRTSDGTVLSGKTLNFYDSTGTTLIGSGVTDGSGRATINVIAPSAGVKVSYKVIFPAETNYATSTGTASVQSKK